jgi:methylmalonyl-CoA mutase N-terminal domain/subunit
MKIMRQWRASHEMFCNILREESHLSNVADPMAGAYALESIVDELAIASWKDFQHNVTQI